MGDHVHYLNRLGRLVNERKAKWTCKPQEKIEIGFSSDTANTQQSYEKKVYLYTKI